MEALLEKEGKVENWNDDRLDELSRRMDNGFKEMRDGFARVDREMKEGFTKVDREMKEGFARVDARFSQIDAKFSQMDAKFDAKFDQVGARLDKLFTAIITVGAGFAATTIAGLVAASQF